MTILGRELSLYLRVLRLALRNPQMIRTALLREYRGRLGIPFYRILDSGRSGAPLELSIHVTRRCNLKCRMCVQYRNYSGERPDLSWYDPAKELPLEAWISLLDQVASFKPFLSIQGGEPMLYSGFQGLIRAAKERGFAVQFSTNGTLLANMAEFLVEQGVAIVFVSIDGPRHVHDHIRGREGLFDRSAAGIRALLEARARADSPGPILGINCTISKDSLAIIGEMVPLALDLGVDVIQLQHTLFDTPENVENHNRLFSEEWLKKQDIDAVLPSIPDGEYYQSEIEREDLPLLRSGLEKAKEQARGRIKLQLLPNLAPNIIEPYYMDLNHPFPQRCDVLWKSCRILPDGTVSPCLHVVAGNIADTPLLDIWNGSTMRRFRQLATKRLFPGCVRCCSRSF